MLWFKDEAGTHELLGFDPQSDSVFHIAESEERDGGHEGRWVAGEIIDRDDEWEGSPDELREIAEDDIGSRHEHPPQEMKASGGSGGWLLLLGLAGLGYAGWRLWQAGQAQQRAAAPQLPPPSSQPYLPGR